MQELNRHRAQAGYLDFELLMDEMVARPGDVLTLYAIDDLGPRSVRAFTVLATIAVRGVKIDFEAVADSIGELWLMHRKYANLRRSRAGVEAKKQPGVKQGGQPSKLDIAIAMYNDIKENGLTISEGLALYNISRNRFYEHIGNLGWPLPKGDTEQ